METGEKPLYVVYEYTEKAGGLAGNRYMTAYIETNFRETFDSEDGITTRDGKERVVAKGIEEKAAYELCTQVPALARLNGARHLAKRSDGTINPTALKMQTANVLLAQRLGRFGP